MSNSIITEIHGSSFVIRFNRPEIRSPLSVHVLDEIDGILDRVSLETERLIFTGVDGVFASGADLREIAELPIDSVREFAERGQRLMDRFSDLTFETFAAIDGPCYGGALDLALACDRRICSPRSTFCHPGAGLGIITGWGGTQRLPRLIGEGNALEMVFTALPIDAKRARDIGLVSGVVDEPLRYLISADFTSTSARENFE
jgi:enoyl-CoA hydratase/carnithine racemase